MKHSLSIFYFGLVIILILTSLIGCIPSQSTATPTMAATPTETVTQPSSPTPAATATQPPPSIPTPTLAESTTNPIDPIAFQSSLTLWAVNKPPTSPDSSSTTVDVSTEHALAGKQSLSLTFDYQKTSRQSSRWKSLLIYPRSRNFMCRSQTRMAFWIRDRLP